MSGPFMAFTWTLSIVCGILAIFLVKAPKVLGFILGLVLAQGFMFVGAHLLKWDFGPAVNIGGTEAYILVDVILALVGGLLGAWISKLFRKNK